jgi:hypothetical protein
VIFPRENGPAIDKTSYMGPRSRRAGAERRVRQHADQRPDMDPGGDPPVIFRGWIELAKVIDALRIGDPDGPSATAPPKRNRTSPHYRLNRARIGCQEAADAGG